MRSLFDDSEAAPDGDVQLTDEQVVDFVTPSCSRCGDGVLKPDIVFFGDNVASNVKEFCCQKLEESDCLLGGVYYVIGYSAKHVFSKKSVSL